MGEVFRRWVQNSKCRTSGHTARVVCSMGHTAIVDVTVVTSLTTEKLEWWGSIPALGQNSKCIVKKLRSTKSSRSHW